MRLTIRIERCSPVRSRCLSIYVFSVCGVEQNLIHCKDKVVSTTNLIVNVEAMSKKCASHAVVDGVLKDANPNYVNVNGEKQKIHTFTESFTYHVDLLWSHGGVLFWNITQRNEDFQHYVRGYEPRAKFPNIRVQERLPEVVLQLLKCKKYITS